MKTKILVVDDSPLVIQLVSRILEREGYGVAGAVNGDEALRLYASERFSLAVLDVNMPGIDGLSLAELLRRHDQDSFLPILFLSAEDERATRIRGLQKGGAVFMVKPFHEEEFLAQVESLLWVKELQDNLAQKNKLLQELCRRDSLTSLYNHAYFSEIGEHEFRRAQRYGSDLACILLDIDDFKTINDTYGHPCGDRVLTELAVRLRKSVRDVDVVARYGGEEFAVLLPMASARHAQVVAERIRRTIASKPFEGKLPITVSLGLATLLENRPGSLQDLVEFADRALYVAKRHGKNCACVYDVNGIVPIGLVVNS